MWMLSQGGGLDHSASCVWRGAKAKIWAVFLFQEWVEEEATWKEIKGE